MDESAVYASVGSFEKKSQSVQEENSLHNLLGGEYSSIPHGRNLPFKRATVQQISSVRPSFDNCSIPSFRGSTEYDTINPKTSASKSSEIGRLEAASPSESLAEEAPDPEQAALIYPALSACTRQPDITKASPHKAPSSSAAKPIPRRKNSRLFFSFKKESVSPLPSSFGTPTGATLNVDTENQERQEQTHTRQGEPMASRRKDRSSHLSADISSFSFPKRTNEVSVKGGLQQRGKIKEAEPTGAEIVVLVNETDRIEEIGKPFDVRHALHVECDDLAVLPLEWVDALKAQGSTSAEILQLAVSKSKSHMLRQNSINLPIPIRPKSPPSPPLSPLPPLPHQPASPSARHSRSSSFIPARSWIPLSGDKTENIRSKLAKRLTKSNSLLFGSSLLGGRKDSSAHLKSPPETAPDTSILPTSSDVAPIKITSPIVVSRKSCVILPSSLISSPSLSFAPLSPSPQPSVKCPSPHIGTPSVPLMSPRLSLDFDIGSFQVSLPSSSLEHSTEGSVPEDTEVPSSPLDESSDRSTSFMTFRHQRPSSLSLSSSIFDSSSSESSPPSVHLSTPGPTHLTTASPSVQTSTPSITYRADTSDWPQPEFNNVRGLAKSSLLGPDSGLGWEERWNQGRRGGKRANVEVHEERDISVVEERHIVDPCLPREQNETCRLEQGDFFMLGRNLSESQGLNQGDRSDDPMIIQSDRSSSLTLGQSKYKRSSTQTSFSRHSSSYSISSADSSQEAVISKAVFVKNTFLVSDVTVSKSSNV